jgi:hypothetical protein
MKTASQAAVAARKYENGKRNAEKSTSEKPEWGVGRRICDYPFRVFGFYICCN